MYILFDYIPSTKLKKENDTRVTGCLYVCSFLSSASEPLGANPLLENRSVLPLKWNEFFSQNDRVNKTGF